MSLRVSDDYYSRKSIESRIGKSANRDWYASYLDGIGAHSSKLQNERFDLAVSYLETHFTELDHSNRPMLDSSGSPVINRREVLEHLKSIDFHSEVKLHDLKRNETLSQRRYGDEAVSKSKSVRDASKENLGSYFSDHGVPAQQLGITVRDPHQKRPLSTVKAKRDMCVLQSRTRPTIDTWSKYRAVRIAKKRTKRGTPIQSGDSKFNFFTLKSGQSRQVSNRLRPTRNAKKSVSRFRSIPDATGTKNHIRHTSGQYVSAGGKQYHIIKATQHKHLRVVHTRSGPRRKR